VAGDQRVETTIPLDRKIDGVSEVTFQSALAPLHGRKQTQQAFEDEINVFRRTLLYAGLPNSSRWYDVAAPGETVGARSLIYLRRRDRVGAGEFRKFLRKQLVPALVETGVLKELRTQTFLPWNEKLWDTPNVAHDKPHDPGRLGRGLTFFIGDLVETFLGLTMPRLPLDALPGRENAHGDSASWPVGDDQA
jgi:hypothetical protein